MSEPTQETKEWFAKTTLEFGRDMIIKIRCYRCSHYLEPRISGDDDRNVFWCPECCEEKVFRSAGDKASDHDATDFEEKVVKLLHEISDNTSGHR